MPSIPFGGLSFFLNVGIVLIRAVIIFFEKKGFTLSWLHAFFSFFTEKEFDKTWRRVLGYSVTTAVFLFLFISMGVSFVNRMNNETNLDLISSAIERYYSVESKELTAAEKIKNKFI